MAVLDRFNGSSNPTEWIFRAEQYFTYLGFSENDWLPLASFYLDGTALDWFQGLHRNKQFFHWKHFTEKLTLHFRNDSNMTHNHINIALDLMRKLDEKLDNIERALCACSHSAAANPVLPDVDDKRDPDLPCDESTFILEDPTDSDSDTVDECVQSWCDDQTHMQVLLPDFTSDLNDGTLKEVSGIHVCKVFAEIPDREIDMKVVDSVKNDLVKPEPQMFDELFHTISIVKCDSSNPVKVEELLRALPCMLLACSQERGLFSYVSELGHAKLPLSLYRLPPDQFGLDFPFDPGSNLFTTFFGSIRDCVCCGALGSCNNSRFMTLTRKNSCIAPFKLRFRNTNRVREYILLEVDDGRHYASYFIVCSLDMLPELAEYHGHDRKCLVSQSNLVGRGVILHVWDPGIHRQPAKLNHLNNDILFGIQTQGGLVNAKQLKRPVCRLIVHRREPFLVGELFLVGGEPIALSCASFPPIPLSSTSYAHIISEVIRKGWSRLFAKLYDWEQFGIIELGVEFFDDVYHDKCFRVPYNISRIFMEYERGISVKGFHSDDGKARVFEFIVPPKFVCEVLEQTMGNHVMDVHSQTKWSLNLQAYSYFSTGFVVYHTFLNLPFDPGRLDIPLLYGANKIMVTTSCFPSTYILIIALWGEQQVCGLGLKHESTAASEHFRSSLEVLLALNPVNSVRQMWIDHCNALLDDIILASVDMIKLEKARQWRGLEFIPSVNLLPFHRSLITIPYSEGPFDTRYDGGNEYIDVVERLCRARAVEIFTSDPANWRLNVKMVPGNQSDTKETSGVSMFLEPVLYKLDESPGHIGYKQRERCVTLFRPPLIVVNASACARLYDYARTRKVCNMQEAVLLVDIAHISGLFASGVICSPFDYATVVACVAQFMGAKVYTTVVFGKSLFALESFGNEQTIFHVVSRLVDVARSMVDHILSFCNRAQFGLTTIGGERATKTILDSNLEDKVLIEGESIVVNQTDYIRAYGLEGMNETSPVEIIGPIEMLESFIWDPGPIINWLNRTWD